MDGDYRELTFVGRDHSKVDGKVWINDSGTWTILRLDIAHGKFEPSSRSPCRGPTFIRSLPTRRTTAYFTVMGREHIGRIDAKTGKVATFPMPTPKSAPRRGSLDAQGRFWFGENRGNKIGVFDPKTNEIQEWAFPCRSTCLMT